MSQYKTDILIIGMGLAGMTAAMTAAKSGKNITIITKTKSLTSGNTPGAQGGIAYKGLEDSPGKLKEDILIAGAGHCWIQAVEHLCEQGSGLVEKILINTLQAPFSKNKRTNRLERASEGAHSSPRILYDADKTGKSIHKVALEYLQALSNVTILANHMAIDLLTFSHHSTVTTDIYKKPACFGAMVLNNKSGEVISMLASKTILATGGVGQLFLHTTNPKEATGDGIAMAWRAGVRCFNMHYIQFHPTALYHPSGRFLISEALRGEGGRLINHKGEEFMHHYHKDKELAPRDIVSRSIHMEMLKQETDCMFLDVSHKKESWIKERFPTIYNHCLSKGINIATEPIPIVPAAHYNCGGVGVNLAGKTSLKRLYAIGEISCTGVHGANRLASTALLECLVWGYFTGKDAVKDKDNADYFPPMHDWNIGKHEIDKARIAQEWLTIKNTMWNLAGLIRSQDKLRSAVQILRTLQSEVEQFYQNSKLDNNILSLRNGAQAALAIISSALEARESLGTHYVEGE
jgi:L-aspartate oxidase